MCSEECGGGIRIHSRVCINSNGDDFCEGDKDVQEACNTEVRLTETELINCL